jgi:hypothetical protein
VEGVASVKEKLKTVSEELEEFVDTSCSVDILRVGSNLVRRSSVMDVDMKDFDDDFFDTSLGLG